MYNKVNLKSPNEPFIQKDYNTNNTFCSYFKIFISAIIIIVCLMDMYSVGTNSKKNNSNLERFYPIIPSFIRPNSNGFFETNRNGLEEIPINKIVYKKEESCFIQEIQSSQMSNIAGNSDSSISTNIAIIHSDANFKYQTDELINNSKKSSSFVVKYIYGYISINPEDIKLKDSFRKKIEDISYEKEYDDEQKAIELDKLFNSYGYYIPQKIYLGGSFIIESSYINTFEKNNFTLDISGKINIIDKLKFNNTYKTSYDEMIHFLNQAQKTIMIGGDKKADNFENWRFSINEDNMEVISYENMLEITNILDHKLKSKIKKPLSLVERKYYLRRKYYEIIEDLKKQVRNKKVKISKSYSEGICEKKNELIYSKKIKIKEKLKLKEKDFNFQKSYSDIIIGWSVNSVESFNGECIINECPILKKVIQFNFVRSFYILGMGYDIELFFMKYPE